MKSIFPRIAAILAVALLCTAAFAQNTHTIFTGRTSVKLSNTFTTALADLDVSVGRVFPTEMENGSVTFPVTGGSIDLDTAAGNILHSGGLTLTAGGTEVRLQSFIIDTTGGRPMITGLVVVNGKLVGRLPLFDLSLPAGFTVPLRLAGNRISLSGVNVTLDAQAAAALNSVFKVSAFQGGLDIGMASVKAFEAGW
jgi:hypothetical protein